MPTGVYKHSCRHGMEGSKEYAIWIGMKQRCFNRNISYYKYYGGRGISVCAEWLKFENFYKDMGKRPAEHSLDRVDNNKGYSKENCRWATRKEQMRNKRDNVIYKGEYSTDACKRLGGECSLISQRIDRGWTVKKAFLTPLNTKYIKFNSKKYVEIKRKS